MPDEPIQLPHGKLHPLTPGNAPGTFKTASGRIINSPHLKTITGTLGLPVATEALHWHNEKPYLYVREADE